MAGLTRRSFLQGLVALVASGCATNTAVPDYSYSAKSLANDIRSYIDDTDFYGTFGIGYSTFTEVSGIEKKLSADSDIGVLVDVLPENVFVSISQKVVNQNGVEYVLFEIPYAKALDVKSRLIQHRQDIIAWEEDFGFGFGE